MATLARPQDDLDARAAALGIAITPLTVNIGAELSGIDLNQPLTDAAAAVIRDAWLRYKVIFLRDQDLSAEAHVRLARLFGELESHPVIPSAPGYPELLIIKGEGFEISAETFDQAQAYNKWHTDVTFRERPSIGSVLRARDIPPVGGDTIWADAAAAYRGLPQAVKDRIEHLEAEHDIVRSFGHRVSDEKRAEIARDFPPVAHPVVRTHPETGERAIYVNFTFTSRILGVSEEESRELLNLLYDRIKVPEYHVRWRWTPNSIAIWDNRVTQHYAVADYWPAPRTMERVTVTGDIVTR